MTSMRRSGAFSFFRSFPLLFLALAAYNMALIWGVPLGAEDDREFVSTTLVSGAIITTGWNEVLLYGGLVLLLLEIIKSTRSTGQATLEHILSILVFVIFLVQFLIVPGAGTTVFALLGLMSLIDVIGGYAISIAVARRDLNIT